MSPDEAWKELEKRSLPSSGLPPPWRFFSVFKEQAGVDFLDFVAHIVAWRLLWKQRTAAATPRRLRAWRQSFHPEIQVRVDQWLIRLGKLDEVSQHAQQHAKKIEKRARKLTREYLTANEILAAVKKTAAAELRLSND